jgi:muramoyltetrapeptide carboxypeptidase
MSCWRPIEPEEPIGVVALSGPVDVKKLARGIAVLESWGHPVEVAANIADRSGYLAGTDDARLDGLNGLLDRGVRLMMSARGGFGATRLLARMPWDRLVADKVRLVGFSDATAVLNHLARTTVQIHGPMVAAGLDRVRNERRLLNVLRGDLLGRRIFEIPDRAVLRHGTATGIVVGGNLSLMSAVMGTAWEPDFRGCVLFLEEVAEPAYRLDRLLTQISGSASFGQVKALISGSLHGCRPHAECARLWAERLVEIAPAGVPVVAGLPFGHGATNMAFPIGSTVEIDTGREAVIWSD